MLEDISLLVEVPGYDSDQTVAKNDIVKFVWAKETKISADSPLSLFKRNNCPRN